MESLGDMGIVSLKIGNVCPDASSDALLSAVVPVCGAIGAIHGESCSKS